MDVRVGSLEDPKKAQGLAHFLEHMLFLGTEKYPDIEEYNRYLSKFQGYSNAYTASKSTNYYFEVNHEGFEGSLDRFAQFFISPLFNEEFVERELNAVHSEHQKNLENDAWRVMQVHRGLYAAGHPALLSGGGLLRLPHLHLAPLLLLQVGTHGEAGQGTVISLHCV